MADIGFLALLLVLTAAALAIPKFWPGRPAWVVGGLLLLWGGGVAAVQFSGVVGFTFLRLACWVVFAAFPLYLLVCARMLRSRWSAALGTLVLAVAVHSFWVEPRMLSVAFHRLESLKLKRPIRVVVLSDLQTDRITAFERKVLLKTRALQPDLVLWSGDYIQEGDPARKLREKGKFNRLLKEVGLSPSLGSFAVGGDVEWNSSWADTFEGAGVECWTNTRRKDLGFLDLVGLDLKDSRVGASLGPSSKFRVVFGHSPDFALASPEADLILAGHTHGGQVQVPFFGPLITLSRVPRRWAGGGLVTLEGGRHLIVSRGLGMERGPAPRLRFNCRPQIVVVDLVPAPPSNPNKAGLP